MGTCHLGLAEFFKKKKKIQEKKDFKLTLL